MASPSWSMMGAARCGSWSARRAGSPAMPCARLIRQPHRGPRPARLERRDRRLPALPAQRVRHRGGPAVAHAWPFGLRSCPQRVGWQRHSDRGRDAHRPARGHRGRRHLGRRAVGRRPAALHAAGRVRSDPRPRARRGQAPGRGACGPRRGHPRPLSRCSRTWRRRRADRPPVKSHGRAAGDRPCPADVGGPAGSSWWPSGRSPPCAAARRVGAASCASPTARACPSGPGPPLPCRPRASRSAAAWRSPASPGRRPRRSGRAALRDAPRRLGPGRPPAAVERLDRSGRGGRRRRQRRARTNRSMRTWRICRVSSAGSCVSVA